MSEEIKTEPELIKWSKEIAAKFNTISDDIGIEIVKIPGKASMMDIDIIFDNVLAGISAENMVNLPDELNHEYTELCTAYAKFQKASGGEEQPPDGEPPANQKGEINTSDKSQPQNAQESGFTGAGTETPVKEKKTRKPRSPNKPKTETAADSASTGTTGNDLEKAVIELYKGASDETIDSLKPDVMKTVLKVLRK